MSAAVNQKTICKLSSRILLFRDLWFVAIFLFSVLTLQANMSVAPTYAIASATIVSALVVLRFFNSSIGILDRLFSMAGSSGIHCMAVWCILNAMHYLLVERSPFLIVAVLLGFATLLELLWLGFSMIAEWSCRQLEAAETPEADVRFDDIE